MGRTILLSVLVAMAAIISVAASGSMQTQSSPLLDLLQVGQVVAIVDGPAGCTVRIWSEEEMEAYRERLRGRARGRARLRVEQSGRKPVEQSDRKPVERRSQRSPEELFAAQNPTITSIGSDHIVFTDAQPRERYILKTAIVEVNRYKKRPDKG
jgi:hypothetical protein